MFQTTLRCLTCAEIANDPALVTRLKDLFDRVDKGTTPATVLFPWFPSPAMLMKFRASKQIYDIIASAVNVRKQSGVPQNDTLQLLLDSNEDVYMIVAVSPFCPPIVESPWRRSCSSLLVLSSQDHASPAQQVRHA